MKKGILILCCIVFYSCATPEQELQLRYAEMQHALEVMKFQAAQPKPVLYESITSDGTRVVVYSPVNASSSPQSTYVSRPLPRMDISALLPVVSLLSTMTGQYYGFRTSEAMFNMLKSNQQAASAGNSSSVDGNTIYYTNTVDSSSKTTAISKDTSYGNYSGNGTAGYDAHTNNSGSTNVEVTDAFKMKVTDESQRTYTQTHTETPIVTPVVQVVPVVVTPIEGGND